MESKTSACVMNPLEEMLFIYVQFASVKGEKLDLKV